MKKKSIWMAVVNYSTTVVFAKGCLSQKKAEMEIVKYLQDNEEFEGKDFGEACFWIGEKDLRLDLMVFEMKAKDFKLKQIKAGLFIEPPPDGKDAYRVVYVIDVVAGSAIQAARQTHQIMIDPDSMPPVLEVIDQCSKLTKIDLSKRTKSFEILTTSKTI